MRERTNYKSERASWDGKEQQNTYLEEGSCWKRGVFAASEGNEGTTCIFNL